MEEQELCWCGSQKPHSNCHAGRSGEKPLPQEAIYAKIAKQRKFNVCLHPEAAKGVCGQIIRAHTIPRSAVLGRIVDTQGFMTSFYPPQPSRDGHFKAHSIGWHEASIFTGFCKHHDDQTFAPLEKTQFNATPEQCFLVSYRALCHELYQKTASRRAHSVLQDTLDRGQSPATQYEIQKVNRWRSDGLTKGFGDMVQWKAEADDVLLNQNFSDWKYCIVYFDGALSIASTGAPTPTYDINHRPVQILTDMHKRIEPLCYGMLVQHPLGGVVVFGWPGNTTAGPNFLDSLLQSDQRRVPGRLVQFMFAHVENTFFSTAWWEGISEGEKAIVERHVNNTNPFASPVRYASGAFVDWEITKITWI